MGTTSVHAATVDWQDPALPEDAALAAIVRSSLDAVISKTVQGVITSWNHGAELLYGYTAEDAIGTNIERMFTVAEFTSERSRHARVAGGASESGYRCHRIRADGRTVEVVMSMLPVRDRDGVITGVATISRPVSPQEESSDRIATVLEAAPDGMVCVDRDRIVRMANSEAHEMFGYGTEELLGLPVDVLVPRALRSGHVRHRQDYVRHPVRRRMGPDLALSAQRRDGSTFPVEISLATDGRGPDALVIAAIRDMTGQRQIEAAVRTSEAHLRQLADHVDTVFLLQQIRPSAYLYVSPAFERVTGWPVDRLADGASFMAELIHPDDLEQVERYLAETVQGNPAHSEHRIIRPDGEVRWVRLFSAPVHNPDGPAERAVLTLEDVTERVAAAEQVQRSAALARSADRAKTAFLSRMSHELRTPLNAILGFAQLLDRQTPDQVAAPSIRQILAAGRHLHDLISDVLDFSRIESGTLTVRLEDLDARAAVTETLALLALMADDAAVTLHPPDAGPPVWLTADRQRLRQVLINLISNAIKYNHRGGNVRIELHQSGDDVGIEVRDDGRGISPAHQSRLFTPFDRLGAELSAVEGTGVGLAVTRGLMHAMAGTIAVRSAVDRGSSFTVSLPRAAPVAAPTPAVPQGSAPTATPSAPRRSVLLYIEDNQPNVHLVESLLGLRPGWSMRHAGTAAEGIELARDPDVDLLFLDMHLPDGLGLDLLRVLKGGRTTADLPVVVLSADADRGLAEQVLAAGALAFMTKPLNIDEILATLDRVPVRLAADRRPGTGR